MGFWVFFVCDAGWFALVLRWCLRYEFSLESGVFAGIRELLARFRRRPCAGRHLLFFAAAKKSRQKKAAHTASSSSCPRAPNVPTLHTVTLGPACVASALSVHLTRFMYPRRSTPRQAVRRRPGGKLCVGCRAPQVSALTRNTNPATSPE